MRAIVADNTDNARKQHRSEIIRKTGLTPPRPAKTSEKKKKKNAGGAGGSPEYLDTEIKGLGAGDKGNSGRQAGRHIVLPLRSMHRKNGRGGWGRAADECYRPCRFDRSPQA